VPWPVRFCRQKSNVRTSMNLYIHIQCTHIFTILKMDTLLEYICNIKSLINWAGHSGSSKRKKNFDIFIFYMSDLASYYINVSVRA
jgi:hypothetical protein